MKKNKENGSASIEASISLVAFLLVVVGIYSFINIAIIQSKISCAINSTAKEMSQYSYFYDVFQVRKLEEKLDKGSEQVINTFNNFNEFTGTFDGYTELNENSGVDEYLDKIEDTIDKGGSVKDDVEEIIDDPIKFLKSIASYTGKKAYDKLAKGLAEKISEAMTMKKLKGNVNIGESLSDEEKKKQLLFISNIDFSGSELFEEGSDDIIVDITYEVELNLLKIGDYKCKIHQKARTRGWLGGDATKK